MAWPNHMILLVLIELHTLYCFTDIFRAKCATKRQFFSENVTFFNRVYLGDGLSDPFEIWHAYGGMLYTSTCTVRLSQFQF